MHYPRDTDSSHKIELASSIDRCFWSKRVAFNGDTVKIHLETSHVRDGTIILLKIMEKGLGAGAHDRQVAEIENNAIANNELVLDYTIDLDEEIETQPMGRERRVLFIKVSIQDYGIDNQGNPSTALTVDSSHFSFSE